METTSVSAAEAEKGLFLMSLLFDRNKISRGRAAEKEINEKALRLGLISADGVPYKYAVIVIKVEDADKAYSNMGDLLPVGLGVFGKKYNCIGVCTFGKLIYLMGGALDGTKAQISYLASEAVQKMERVAHVRFSVGVSSICASLTECDRCYEEAAFVISYLPDRSGGVYFADDVIETMELEHNRLSYIVSQVEGLLKVGDRGELERYMEDLFSPEKLKGLNKANADMLRLQLSYCIHKAVYDLSDSPAADRFLTSQMIGRRTYMSNDELLKLSLEAKDIISNQRKQNSEVLCDRAMHIIESEYGDETLSLVNISERLHVSSSYLSAILRKNRGDTFVNLLTAKRMYAAREYLVCTSMKIMEVARRCGYSDQHYFSYCFKRYYGVSPNKVRKSGGEEPPAETVNEAGAG